MAIRFERGAARIAATFSLLALLGCTGDSDSVRTIDTILQERASHLTAGDRREIAAARLRAGTQTGLNSLLLLALMEEESHYNSRAKSRRGARGLLQVRPATGREVAERHEISWKGHAVLFEPRTNIVTGAHYLRELRRRFGSLDLALTAYNHGPTKTITLARRGRVPSSRYAARVLRRHEALRDKSTR